MELNFDWLNLHVGALVGTALVFGGMSFFAFVFTPMVFKFVEREDAAHFLRQVFPVYHRVIASLCCAPAVLLIPGRYTPEVTALLAVALLNVVSARFIVPAADAAREAGRREEVRRHPPVERVPAHGRTDRYSCGLDPVGPMNR